MYNSNARRCISGYFQRDSSTIQKRSFGVDYGATAAPFNVWGTQSSKKLRYFHVIMHLGFYRSLIVDNDYRYMLT